MVWQEDSAGPVQNSSSSAVPKKSIAVFLASGYADYISGAVIPVDGGYLGK